MTERGGMPEKKVFSERLSWESAEACIRGLELSPLPGEGGYFRRIYTARKPLEFPETSRRSASGILYLLGERNISRLHRLRKAEELWFFLEGSPVEHLVLSPSFRKRTLLGSGPERTPFVLVPSGAWQGARLLSPSPGAYALFGITVSPEYAEQDYEVGDPSELLRSYPDWKSFIVNFS